MLLLDGARFVLRPRADGGGGFDKNGNKDSRFFLSLPTSAGSGIPGEETAMRLPVGRFGFLGGGLGGPVPLLDWLNRGDGARLECLALDATETLELFILGVSLPVLPPVLERTLAVTLEASRFRGDMLLENALGVPVELLARLRLADPLARVEGVDK